MPYTITITKTEVQEVESGGDWTIVGEEPITKDSLELKKVYGYTPKITKSGTVTVEIFRQVVGELDLPAVIRAVNKL